MERTPKALSQEEVAEARRRRLAYIRERARDAEIVHADAQGTIEQHNVIRLSAKDQQRLADMLLNPPEPSAVLTRAKKVHDDLILQSRRKPTRSRA